jgi:LPS export ABC transporter protein LptC
MRRIVLIIVALGLGLGLVYLIFVRELPRTEEQSAASLQQTIDMNGIVMRQMRGDTLEWVVTSDHAVFNETAKQAELTPVHFEVLQTGGKTPEAVHIEGTARSAFVDQRAERVTLRGNSHITKDGSLELSSDELEYTHSTGTVRATGHVQVVQDGAQMQADSAEYVIGTGKLKMQAPSLYQ